MPLNGVMMRRILNQVPAVLGSRRPSSPTAGRPSCRCREDPSTVAYSDRVTHLIREVRRPDCVRAEAAQALARVKVTCVTPLGEDVASTS